MRAAIIIAALAAGLGCSRGAEREEPRKPSLLRYYVRTPIDKAKAADEQARRRNRALAEAAGEDL